MANETGGQFAAWQSVKQFGKAEERKVVVFGRSTSSSFLIRVDILHETFLKQFFKISADRWLSRSRFLDEFRPSLVRVERSVYCKRVEDPDPAVSFPFC
jgi:hypothetical protein